MQYRTHRRHCTYFEGAQSDYADFNSDVIQGSGLGPIFFLLAISDYKLVLKITFY